MAEKMQYLPEIKIWVEELEELQGEAAEQKKEEIKRTARPWCMNYLKSRTERFGREGGEEAQDEITNGLKYIDNSMKMLEEKTGLDVYDHAFKNEMAAMVWEAIKAYDVNVVAKSTAYRGRPFLLLVGRKWVLGTAAYDYFYDEDLCAEMSDEILTTVRRMIRDDSVSDQHRETLKRAEKDWIERKKRHTLATRKSDAQQALKDYWDMFGEEAREAGIRRYWEQHPQEKQQLQQQIEQLQQEQQRHTEADSKTPAKDRLAALKKECEELEEAHSRLGFFKFKEKKELEGRLEEKRSACSDAERARTKEKNSLKATLAKLQKEIDGAREELTCTREPVMPAAADTLQLFDGGVCQVSGRGLMKYLQKVLPGEIQVGNSSEETDPITDWDEAEYILDHMSERLEAALAGRECTVPDYFDDPNKEKHYRIYFSRDGADGAPMVSFRALARNKPIQSEICFEMYQNSESGTKGLALLLHAAAYALHGICPNMDVVKLAQDAIPVAYRLKPSFAYEEKGMRISVTADIRQNLQITLSPAKA